MINRGCLMEVKSVFVHWYGCGGRELGQWGPQGQNIGNVGGVLNPINVCFVCLFGVWGLFTRECFTYMEPSPLPMKGFKF